MSRRQDRVNDLLREVLAEIVARELKDPRLDLELLSVTEVRVSADLRRARVLVSAMGSDLEQAGALAALNHSRGFIRRLLRKRLAMKAIPELQFERDDRIAEDHRIQNLLDSLEPDSTATPDLLP
ncbi:MAG: 30S ribosome-binding factor RbfA [Dehalococcoidia bacterium]